MAYLEQQLQKAQGTPADFLNVAALDMPYRDELLALIDATPVPAIGSTMALKDYGVPTVDSILKGTMSRYGDPTEGYKPLPLPKEQEPSKKEREKMAALAAQDAITREALSVIEELRSQDYWRNSSWQRKQEILDNYRTMYGLSTPSSVSGRTPHPPTCC